MKINLAKSAGFCFGVRRAIDIALKTANSSKKIYMLGDIVHNEDVVREIEKAGIKKIKRLEVGKNKILLIRAHGAPRSTIDKAVNLGYKIVDATCPMVCEIHKIAKNMEEKGYPIIIIGDRNHDEVQGIIGQLKEKTIVIDNLKNIPQKTIKNLKKACIVVQSTQNLDNTLKILDILKSRIQELKFFNTICKPTRIKQDEIRRIPCENDIMIILGSKNSANTRRLYEISKSLNKRSYWISSKREIKPEWFKEVKSAGVTAGASTPEWRIREVVSYVSKIA